MKAIRDEKNMKYVKRFKFRHDQGILKEHKFKVGDLVGYFIGDRSGRPTNQWWSRYQIYRLVEFVHNMNAVRIQNIDDPKEEYTVARDMIIPYFDGSDWMDELDYIKMIENRNKDYKLSQRQVKFDQIHS